MKTSGLLLSLCSLLNIFIVVSGSAGSAWNYELRDNWVASYPHCGGHKQSPINIVTSKVKVNASLGEMFFGGYSSVSNVNMSIQNNGHTVEVDLKGRAVTIEGASLPGKYRAAQFHFHWGSEDKRGSEHLINGQHFPMEMHIVHYSQSYPTISLAQDKENGLAVLAFLFKIGKHNRHFDEVITHFNKIEHKDQHTTIGSFPMQSLLPSNLRVYYRYYGSLTTPPCYESIIWTVFKERIEISEEQLNRFRNNVHRNVAGEPDKDISDDYRFTQPLNHRMVYASDEAIYESTAIQYLPSICLLFCLQLLLII